MPPRALERLLVVVCVSQASVAYYCPQGWVPAASPPRARHLDLLAATWVPPGHDRSSRHLFLPETRSARGMLGRIAQRGLGPSSVLYARRRSRERREMTRREEVTVEPTTAMLADGEGVFLAVADRDSPYFEQALDLLRSEVENGEGTLPFENWPQAEEAVLHRSCIIASARLGAGEAGDLVGGCFVVPRHGLDAEQHICELWIVTAGTARRRGVAALLAAWTMEALPRFGFENVVSFRTYASNKAAVQLLRGLDFKLIGVFPRAAYLPGKRGATDAFLFSKDIRQKRDRQRGVEGGVRVVEDEEGGGGSGEEHETWMMEAEKEAIAAGNKGEVPVGAVIVRDGSVIGRGCNGMIFSCDPSGHAEVLAIRDAASRSGNYRLNGCTLYVTLEPCVMCAGAIIHSRLSKVVYGARDPKAGCAGSVLDLLQGGKFNHVVQVEGGVREAETAAILSDFFARRRNSSLKGE